MGQSAPQCCASHTCWSLGWICVSVLVSTPSPALEAHGLMAFLVQGCRWAPSLMFSARVCVCSVHVTCVERPKCHRHLTDLGWARISLHLTSR